MAEIQHFSLGTPSFFQFSWGKSQFFQFSWGTGWGPPVISWFITLIIPINYSYIYHKPLLSHFTNQLNAIDWGPHPVINGSLYQLMDWWFIKFIINILWFIIPTNHSFFNFHGVKSISIFWGKISIFPSFMGSNLNFSKFHGVKSRFFLRKSPCYERRRSALRLDGSTGLGCAVSCRQGGGRDMRTWWCFPYLIYWYVYHSQSWVVYDTVFPTLLELG